MEMVEFIKRLAMQLTIDYSPRNVGGGHDYTHVLRMIKLGDKIKKHLDFNWHEYVMACWLHNIDRCKCHQEDIKKKGLLSVLLGLLDGAPLDDKAKLRVIIAAHEHHKKDDEPQDSQLLMALRIADKLDRLSPLGIMAGAAHRGGEFPAYNPDKPFGYADTGEDSIRNIYVDYFRILEWYGMLPADWARDLVNKEYLHAFIQFLRVLGLEIAEVCNTKNNIEDDIKKALGNYYRELCPDTI